MTRVWAPRDVEPDEAAAALSAIQLYLEQEGERGTSVDGNGRWVLAARVEAVGAPITLDAVRRWRRR